MLRFGIIVSKRDTGTEMTQSRREACSNLLETERGHAIVSEIRREPFSTTSRARLDELNLRAANWVINLWEPNSLQLKWRAVSKMWHTISWVVYLWIVLSSPFVFTTSRQLFVLDATLSVLVISCTLIISATTISIARRRYSMPVLDHAVEITKYLFESGRQDAVIVVITVSFARYLFDENSRRNLDFTIPDEVENALREALFTVNGPVPPHPELLALCNRVLDGAAKWTKIPDVCGERFRILGDYLAAAHEEVTLVRFNSIVGSRVSEYSRTSTVADNRALLGEFNHDFVVVSDKGRLLQKVAFTALRFLLATAIVILYLGMIAKYASR